MNITGSELGSAIEGL